MTRGNVEVSLNFRQQVEMWVARIPYGQVATYGELAALSGQAAAARIVGGIAHYGDPTLPWHRVVNRFGGLASGFPGGREVQATLLNTEGVPCDENHTIINFEAHRWRPLL
ncbi:methylated-DNA--[protein]-cysteine S-methyltransferase [Candidatus Saccharibacteria bacterium]|nr:methylated-DNA--[protein]-cysteine S-methyltransferase [Candidatus Saccharibacteria bacterium]